MKRILIKILSIILALVAAPYTIMISVMNSTFNFYGALWDSIKNKKS